MKTRVFALLIVAVFMASCKKEVQKPASAVAKTIDSVTVEKDSLKGDPIPVFGYRFVITGDFDGDGKPENLVEHYYSRRDKKEAYKFYDNVEDDWQMWDSVVRKRPYSFALSDNRSIDTLRISKEKQLYGIAYLKNEGDLNGDGTDEVSYVVDYADASSMNGWYVVTYKNKKWQELYSFIMWDWQLPDRPGFVDVYGYFGHQKKIGIPANDTLNRRLERELKAFPGLLKKVGENRVQVIYNNQAEVDTMTVSLKRPK
ncbi:hypothetical protein AM493_09610 [Flavobacterium akiainvivens]|uniref:Uncharacterized protein n=1 Tax=Flavobacterium akiainvivens TaxID=1202724 RepID=A0A0M9VIC1_9FLAO|nr:hypothetical protein [Flavobacterium akiainvivens]KOS06259.1 hypothetical protein AM493_09610 [Flavobacterium akiainvivens]SFQ17722.1 hypothetical protein SAMN05444144_101443 [Flavobacterium akiainvivens]